RLGKALPRELPGFRLEDVFVRGDQKIKPHVVVNQHAALRYRDEKTELDKDQQDGNEDAAKRQRGAALLMRKNAPGNVQRHDPVSLVSSLGECERGAYNLSRRAALDRYSETYRTLRLDANLAAHPGAERLPDRPDFAPRVGFKLVEAARERRDREAVGLHPFLDLVPE